MQDEIKNNDKISNILFFGILLTLIPVVISSTIITGFKASGLYSVVVGLAYSAQAGLIFFYYIRSNSTLKINEEIFIFAWIFMTAQMLTIGIDSLTGVQINYLDFINIFIRLISVLIFVGIPYQLSISKQGFEKFMNYIVLLGFLACIYNMIINLSDMKNILYISNAYSVDFKSFYLNRNSFAQILFIATIANTFLFLSERSLFRWASYFVFGINIIATLSRTVIASTSIFTLILLLFYFRKKLLKSMMFLIGTGSVITIILSNKIILNFVVNMLIREEMGTTNRSNLWHIGFEILNKSNWFFGIGYFTGKDFLEKSGYLSVQFHNFFIETLVGGGILEIFLFLLIFTFIFKKIRSIFKNDKTVGAVYFVAYIALVFYALFESVSFFSMGYVDSIFTIFFITLPILYKNNVEKHNRRS